MTDADSMHVREQGSVLSKVERRALQWIARRLPPWINSDHLTLLAFVAMFIAGAAYWTADRNRLALLVAVAGLAVNWFGDSLDGTLARVRNRQRPRYGFYVDHVLDIVGSVLLLAGLAHSGYMNPLIAIGMLAAYLMVVAEEFLATHVRRVFRLSFLRIGPTELRIILAVGTLYLLYTPWVRLGTTSVRLFDVGGIIAIGGLALRLIVSAIRNTRALYLAEPLPRYDPQAASCRHTMAG